MKTTTKYLIAFTAFITIAISCNKDDDDGEASENSEAKEITSFAFAVSNNEALEADIQGIINQDVKTIAVTVPYETNITALTPVIEVSRGASYTPEGAQDFTEPVTYTVTAQNGSSAEYTVTVLLAENNDVQILSFQFLANDNSALTQNINTIINIDDYSITATVPYETSITALVPAITTSTGATYTPEGAQDFTEPVEYTVTAANGEITQTYTVTVTIEEPAGALALQWQALMDIYEASYSSDYQVYLLDWDISNPEADISTWEGVTTDADGYVTEIILSGKIGSYQVPESIGNLIRLQVLDLVNNYITELPSSIGNLTQLRQLFLGFNDFTELPSSIGGLSQLQELRAPNNNLTELSVSLSNLNGLQILDLRYNNLSGAFPEWIGGLSELQYLDIRNNSFDALPDELMDLENLTYIDITDNNFGMLSGDLCEYLAGIEEHHMDEDACP